MVAFLWKKYSSRTSLFNQNKMHFSFLAKSESALLKFAELVAGIVPSKKVIMLEAPMAAGKTTFVNLLSRCLGVTDFTSSPTFSIVNEYHGNETIFHFDLYRFNSIDEAYDIGFEEYLDKQAICLVEWPEIAIDLMPSDAWKIQIDVLEDNQRRFHLYL